MKIIPRFEFPTHSNFYKLIESEKSPLRMYMFIVDKYSGKTFYIWADYSLESGGYIFPLSFLEPSLYRFSLTRTGDITQTIGTFVVTPKQ